MNVVAVLKPEKKQLQKQEIFLLYIPCETLNFDFEDFMNSTFWTV